LLSKFQQWAGQQLGRATPRAAKHDDEEPAVEEAVAASVEWIMVRLDLLLKPDLLLKQDTHYFQ
jgi:hypothetical protein